jgi:hypothetical protein
MNGSAGMICFVILIIRSVWPRPTARYPTAVAIQPVSALSCDAGPAFGGYAVLVAAAGVRAGGSQGPVVNSWRRASSASMPHLAAVDR